MQEVGRYQIDECPGGSDGPRSKATIPISTARCHQGGEAHLLPIRVPRALPARSQGRRDPLAPNIVTVFDVARGPQPYIARNGWTARAVDDEARKEVNAAADRRIGIQLARALTTRTRRAGPRDVSPENHAGPDTLTGSSPIGIAINQNEDTTKAEQTQMGRCWARPTTVAGAGQGLDSMPARPLFRRVVL